MANVPDLKQCSICEEWKPLDAYLMHSKKRLKPRAYCKACGVRLAQQYKAQRPLYQLKYDLQRKYGISLDTYYLMLEAQDGKCSICGAHFSEEVRGRRLCVDHCHNTGKVRGLLCFNCNTGLGKFSDDPMLLAKALIYLSKKED